MISLRDNIPSVVLDLKYAGTNNFMHRRMYPEKTNDSYLRLPAGRGLQLVQQELKLKGYGLKIFDAYRPYSVSVEFWKIIHDERYVADPKKGSGHNKGISVDLTIIDLETQKELDMGTSFDNFTDSAHQSFNGFSSSILANRKLLKETMEKYGFNSLETEWWHYSWPDTEQFEALDFDISKGEMYFKNN